ncbi:hypothetical protein TcasGA2_TC006959 [Tribolium castaneum]|uniref:Double jelly roll-like domain-containing protein n=2 Tax=Tribolium castaneum TaxID=7070 RepID=D7EIY9_TRICA|nr:hypothetical protein TcasGA2_TC016185 [Tribolium castaneum]EFA13351.1 hypothetical protein TcasGA2_TC006959 [Tribolium castaneum]
MNFEILNVNEKAVFDTSISYAEKRTHQPYASTSFNLNDEIRLPIEHQDVYTLPWLSSLYIEGKVIATNDKHETIISPNVKFANNGIMLMFDEVRYEIAGNVVDRVRNPGLASIMKGYATYNTNESIALQNAGWFPKSPSTIIDQDSGYFNVVIPLRLILGLCEDFRKIILNVRQELVLVRSNTDLNALVVNDETVHNVKINISKIFWKMPHITVSDAERLRLIDTLSKNRELDVPFRSRELHEYPLLPQTQRHTWSIKTSIEKPQYIFFGLQTDRKNQLSKDYSQFDHCNLRNVKVYLNDEMYPYDNLNLNFNNNSFAALYEMFIEFQASFLDKVGEPIFTPEEFKTIAPIVVVDCTKQSEMLKRSPVSIRLEFETRTNIPGKTTAHCLILHDRVAKYIPAQGVIRVV